MQVGQALEVGRVLSDQAIYIGEQFLLPWLAERIVIHHEASLQPVNPLEFLREGKQRHPLPGLHRSLVDPVRDHVRPAIGLAACALYIACH